MRLTYNEFDRRRLDKLREHSVQSLPYCVLAPHEVGSGCFAAQRKVDSVEIARLYARQGQRSLAQRLARHRTGVRACLNA